MKENGIHSVVTVCSVITPSQCLNKHCRSNCYGIYCPLWWFQYSFPIPMMDGMTWLPVQCLLQCQHTVVHLTTCTVSNTHSLRKRITPKLEVKAESVHMDQKSVQNYLQYKNVLSNYYIILHIISLDICTLWCHRPAEPQQLLCNMIWWLSETIPAQPGEKSKNENWSAHDMALALVTVIQRRLL